MKKSIVVLGGALLLLGFVLVSGGHADSADPFEVTRCEVPGDPFPADFCLNTQGDPCAPVLTQLRDRFKVKVKKAISIRGFLGSGIQFLFEHPAGFIIIECTEPLPS